MKTLMPFTPVPTLRSEIDRMLARFRDDDVLAPAAFADWAPALDVSEADGNYTIKAECPGMDEKDIRIKLEGDLLILEGEKKNEFEEKKDRIYRKERTYGAFSRTVRLPTTVDATKVTAKLHDGILSIHVPKTAVTKGNNIPIQVT